MNPNRGPKGSTAGLFRRNFPTSARSLALLNAERNFLVNNRSERPRRGKREEVVGEVTSPGEKVSSRLERNDEL